MAYLFTAASSQYLIGGSAPVTAEPFTMACWYRPTATPGSNVPLAIGGNTLGRCQLVLQATSIQASRISDANTSATAVSVTAANSAGVWVHTCGTYDTAGNNIISWRNGVAGTPVTNPGTAMTLGRVTIGARLQSLVPGAYANGDIAEVGIWNVVLTAAEIAALAKGIAPHRIRPQNLVFYPRLIRGLVETRRGLALTNTNGATVSNHCRIIG